MLQVVEEVYVVGLQQMYVPLGLLNSDIVRLDSGSIVYKFQYVALYQ
jgi:hypothetical protein